MPPWRFIVSHPGRGCYVRLSSGSRRQNRARVAAPESSSFLAINPNEAEATRDSARILRIYLIRTYTNRFLNPPVVVYTTSSSRVYDCKSKLYPRPALLISPPPESRFNAARRQFVIYVISGQKLAISLLMNSRGITIASQFLRSAFVTVVTSGEFLYFPLAPIFP